MAIPSVARRPPLHRVPLDRIAQQLSEMPQALIEINQSIDSLSLSGNGGIMRLASVPLFVGVSDPVGAITLAATSSRLTHGSVAACDSARLLALYILRALRGASKEQLLAPVEIEGAEGRFAQLPEYWSRECLCTELKAIADGSFKHKQPPPWDDPDVAATAEAGAYIKGSGYSVETLEAALWAFYTTNSFEEGALAAGSLTARSLSLSRALSLSLSHG